MSSWEGRLDYIHYSMVFSTLFRVLSSSEFRYESEDFKTADRAPYTDMVRKAIRNTWSLLCREYIYRTASRPYQPSRPSYIIWIPLLPQYYDIRGSGWIDMIFPRIWESTLLRSSSECPMTKSKIGMPFTKNARFGFMQSKYGDRSQPKNAIKIVKKRSPKRFKRRRDISNDDKELDLAYSESDGEGFEGIDRWGQNRITEWKERAGRNKSWKRSPVMKCSGQRK